MPTPTISRKRSRAQFTEQDELTSEIEQTPLSKVKKKRLNTETSSPAKATVYGTLKRKVGGMLVWPGKGKENAGVADAVDELADAVDELADADATMENKSSPVKDIYDVPSSGAEEDRRQGPRRRNGIATSRTTASSQKKIPPTRKASGRKPPEQKLLEEPATDANEALTDGPTPGRMQRRTNEKSKAKPSVPASSPDTPRKRGRPSKASLLGKAKKLSNQATRDAMIAEAAKAAENNSTKHIKKSAHEERTGESPATAESEDRREQQSRHTKHTLEPPKELKSALTPSKNRRGRPRKSVVFDENDDIDLGFKDLDTTTSAKKSKSKSIIGWSPVEIVDPDGEEERVASAHSNSTGEIACAICMELHTTEKNPIIICEKCDYGIHLKCSPDLKIVPNDIWLCGDCNPEPDSEDTPCAICLRRNDTKANPIILCDGCDYGVHLDCSTLVKVPKGDWFCQKCEEGAEAGLEPEQISFTKIHATVDETSSSCPKINGFESHLQCMQRVLLDKLTGKKRIKLQGHDEEMQKVRQIVEQTIVAGEGNSMLIIGARGCGKTTLVENVIVDLAPEHKDSYHVVRLNGFIHTDDKVALKEIWRQLGREMDVDDDTATRSNYADTLASLLALLSHPSEISDSQPDRTAKSVIFILDEFDLFTTHSRQTLLYNLFDIAQAKKAPIVVLGLTTRVDVVESLEKRVKSRFSHRYVHLSLPRSIPAYWDICQQGLTADEKEFAEAHGSNNASREEFLSFWQNMVEKLYEKDALFKHYVESQFYRSKSVPAFFTSCIFPLANLSATRFSLSGKSFASAISLVAPDSKLQILQGLSELELALLISAARLDIIQDTDTCNFAMAYDEYSSLTSRHKMQTSTLGSSAKVWGREVALGAWERLADYELLVPAGIGGGGGRDFSAGGRMWKVDVGLEEITGSVDGLSTVMTKWCREI